MTLFLSHSILSPLFYQCSHALSPAMLICPWQLVSGSTGMPAHYPSSPLFPPAQPFFINLAFSYTTTTMVGSFYKTPLFCMTLQCVTNRWLSYSPSSMTTTSLSRLCIAPFCAQSARHPIMQCPTPCHPQSVYHPII